MDNLLDLRAVCCTCLKVTHSTISIQQKDLKYNVSLAEMVNKICSIEFKPNDECSDKLCYTCADKLRNAYDFRLMCEDSRTILLSHRENNQHPVPLLPQTGVEEFNHDENLASVDSSNDLIEYVGEEEYLEEYLVDVKDTVSSNHCQNLEEDIDDSIIEECSDHETVIAEQSIAEEDNAISEIETESETNPDDPHITDEDKMLENENRCTICGVVLSKMAHLRRHMKTHSASKPHRCTQCPKTFTRSDNLRVHEANHSQERRFKCPQCDQRFKRTYAMKVHMGVRHKHFVEANFHVCTICSTFFKTIEQLKVHMNKHRIENRFVCYVCGKTYAELLPYEVHVKKHASEEPFDCFHCSKQFPSKAHLMLHIRYHSADKSFKCRYCETSFARIRDLKVHEDYHTGTKNHTCKTCGKSFHRQCALKTHMMTHTEEKPYPCSHCPKKFRQKYDMITHERRHTGERFQCDMCVEKFIHVHQLNSHLKIVHNCEVQCRRRGVTKIFNEPSYLTRPPVEKSVNGNEI